MEETTWPFSGQRQVEVIDGSASGPFGGIGELRIQRKPNGYFAVEFTNPSYPTNAATITRYTAVSDGRQTRWMPQEPRAGDVYTVHCIPNQIPNADRLVNGRYGPKEVAAVYLRELQKQPPRAQLTLTWNFEE
jgi:hypothetical protein